MSTTTSQPTANSNSVAFSLPKSWVLTTVGAVYNIVGGGTPPTTNQEYWRGDIPWITSADILGLDGISPKRFINQQAIEESATNLVPPESIIVVTRVGLGKVALTKEAMCFSQDSQALVQTEQYVLPQYALYYLSKAVQIFKYESRGTTIAGVTKKQLAALPLPLPPLAEQRRIVEAIETELTRLDAGVASLKAARAKLRRYQASVLKAACEGRLVAQDPSDEPASALLQRILAERRERWAVDRSAVKAGPRARLQRTAARYNEPAAPNVAGLTELPMGWVWVTVEQIAPLLAGYAFSTAGFRKSGVRLLKGNNVRDGWLSEDEIDFWDPKDIQRFAKFLLCQGDIVIAMDRPVYSSGSKATKVARISQSWDGALLLQRVGKFQASSWINKGYLYIYLSGLEFRRYLVTSQNGSQDGKDLPHISAGVVGCTLLPLPPLDEQQRIVAEVERRLSVVAALEAAVAANLKRAERLRQAILKRAFEGKIVPQDPSDEPASVLLERIRAARQESVASPASNGRRGRPRKAEGGAQKSPSDPPKRRGRPRKEAAQTTGQPVQDVEQLRMDEI